MQQTSREVSRIIKVSEDYSALDCNQQIIFGASYDDHTIQRHALIVQIMILAILGRCVEYPSPHRTMRSPDRLF